MDLIIDANILFAALLKDGTTRRLILLNQGKFNFYAPQLLIEEVMKYSGYISKKTNLGVAEIEGLLRQFMVASDIRIIENAALKRLTKRALKISPDKYDAPYFAAALYKRCGIWSNDRKLKEQKEIRVISTDELIIVTK